MQKKHKKEIKEFEKKHPRSLELFEKETALISLMSMEITF